MGDKAHSFKNVNWDKWQLVKTPSVRYNTPPWGVELRGQQGRQQEEVKAGNPGVEERKMAWVTFSRGSCDAEYFSLLFIYLICYISKDKWNMVSL